MSTIQERRRYMRGIWALDGMLDDPVSLRLTEKNFGNLLGHLPDHLYETEIRKACRVLGRLLIWADSEAGCRKCYFPAETHLEALLAMDSESGSDESETTPRQKAKKGSGGNAPATGSPRQGKNAAPSDKAYFGHKA